MFKFRKQKHNVNKEVKVATSETAKANKLFTETPIWRALLTMALPSMILMLVLGSYFFFDSVLSINLAADNYGGGVTGAQLVRYSMNGYSPINSLMIAFSLLIGMGISTRVSINLGAKRKDRAINTIKSGTMIGLSIAIVMTPILIMVAKPWIGSQYSQLPTGIKNQIIDNAFKYAWPVILSFPLMMFNQTISGLLRVEARNKQMMIALIAPVFINLFMDWVLMGPVGMGVEGGAWATFISTCATTLLLTFFIYRTKNSVIRFGHLFGVKFHVLSIIGIVLVGIAPFLRNIGQTITQTPQMNNYQTISNSVYGAPGSMLAMSTGLMPIFALFFPVMFAFAQASRPIASFNYGAKNYGRVKQVYWWTLLYATTAAIIIYFTVAWGLAGSLMDLLKVQDQGDISYIKNTNDAQDFLKALTKGFQDTSDGKIIYSMYQAQIDAWNIGLASPTADHARIILEIQGTFGFAAKTESLKAIKFLMLALIGFGGAIAAMVIFGSTDKILLSVIASSMQGLILLWPVLYGIQEIAVTHIDFKYWVWFMWPIINIITSVVLTLAAAYTMHHLGKGTQVTLDSRISIINSYLSNKDFKATRAEMIKTKKEDITNAKEQATGQAKKDMIFKIKDNYKKKIIKLASAK